MNKMCIFKHIVSGGFCSERKNCPPLHLNLAKADYIGGNAVLLSGYLIKWATWC